MSAISDLFATVADFQEVVPGMGASVSFDKLHSSAFSAKKQIEDIITSAVYISIIDGNDLNLKTALKTALANSIMAKQAVFDSIEYRKSDIAVYKNELELIKRGYIENYYNALDSLLKLLKNNEAWNATPFALKQNDLKIKSADEFTLLYPIDSSYLFYFRTIPIQEEVLDEVFDDKFFAEGLDKKVTRKILRALAMLVVSVAIKRFDPLELPATIRNLIEDTTASRNADGEQIRLLNLSSELAKKALDIVQSVESILTVDGATSIDTDTSFNQETDKFFFMG